MNADFSVAESVLKDHWQDIAAALGHGQPNSAEAKSQALEYVGNLTGFFAASATVNKEDKREAAKMAVDASKILFQIAIALLLLQVGFAQFAIRQGMEIPSWPAGILIVSGLLTCISMWLGFIAIGGIYRRGGGREIVPDPWSTELAKVKMGVQSLLGALALIAFVVAALVWAITSDSAHDYKVSTSNLTSETEAMESDWIAP